LIYCILDTHVSLAFAFD